MGESGSFIHSNIEKRRTRGKDSRWSVKRLCMGRKASPIKRIYYINNCRNLLYSKKQFCCIGSNVQYCHRTTENIITRFFSPISSPLKNKKNTTIYYMSRLSHQFPHSLCCVRKSEESEVQHDAVSSLKISSLSQDMRLLR